MGATRLRRGLQSQRCMSRMYNPRKKVYRHINVNTLKDRVVRARTTSANDGLYAVAAAAA